MALERPIAEYDSVKTWGEGLLKQWGEDLLAVDPDMLKSLEAFCAFVGEDPDAIVGKCFRIRKADGERVLSTKWRKHYADKIKEFRSGEGSSAEVRQRGAAVMGFLVHNGVLIQV
jgi:hypothetical protein